MIEIVRQEAGGDPEDMASQADLAIYDVYGKIGLEEFNRLYADNPTWSLEEVMAHFSDRPTSSQTGLFREMNIIGAAEFAVPFLAQEAQDRPVRILEVGCSTGEESYSLSAAILATGQTNFSIRALDSNPDSLKVARTGEYEVFDDIEHLQEGSAKFPSKYLNDGYFQDAGKTWKLTPSTRDLAIVRPSDEVASKVTFVQHDIMDKPIEGEYDLAVLNNVLMHYPDNTRDFIIGRVIESLRPEGVLTVEAPINGWIGVDGENWLKPYNEWRESFAKRFSLEEQELPGKSYMYGMFYNTPSTDSSAES